MCSDIFFYTKELKEIKYLIAVFARIRRFSEQNLDAITTEAIRVRTGAVGYSRPIIFR